VIYTGETCQPAVRWNGDLRNTNLNSPAKREVAEVVAAGALRMTNLQPHYVRCEALATEAQRIVTINKIKKSLGLPPLLNKRKSGARPDIKGLVFRT
jgi:hypothetical protein